MTQENNYYKLSIDETLKALGTNINGLTEEDVKSRLEKFGANELREKEKEPAWKLLLSQFNNLLIYILILSAIISMLLGKAVEPIAIIVIVVLAGITGFVQEFQAGKAIESLRKMASPSAKVRRNGKIIEIPAKELVPGDIILLSAGDKAPADARIINANLLRVEEAALTGESVPVSKHSNPISGDNIPLGDRKNMLYMGTAIVQGRAEAVVVYTGMQTEFGKIATLLDETQTERTPLQKNLDKLGKQLGIFSIVLATLVSVLDFLRGSPLAEVFVWGVALAVAIIPEALPAVVTITLALGVKRMVKRRALIRKLPAVETLGSTNIICSDKTGTLTQDEMTIKKVYVFDRLLDITGSGYAPEGKILENGVEINPHQDKQISEAVLCGVLCNDANLTLVENEWQIVGDPTEGSIIVLAKKLGFDPENVKSLHKRVGEIPFSSETKKMTTVNQFDGKMIAISKGAPEIILAQCDFYFDGEAEKPLTREIRDRILQVYQEMAENALRAIAIAKKALDDKEDEQEKSQTFLGIFGMIDPPREEVKDAIKLCETAGIKPIMITGDHKITAVAIAKELGIMKNGIAIAGPELEAMKDGELEKVIDNVEVFARISPAHKQKIVDALIKKGNIVAMTGDGVNDAPSLKRADIGVAMGITGTEVSKEAADMILTDDNFASIVAAVEEGRSIFENIRKYLVYLLSGNMGTVFGLVAALLAGFATPLTAVQILFINFVMDGILAITLGVEPPEKGIMQRKPRPKSEGILNKLSVSYIGVIGIWIGVICFAVFMSYSNDEFIQNVMRNLGISMQYAYEPHRYAMTMFFVTLIMARIFNVFATRSITESFFKYGIKNNNTLIVGVGVTIILCVLTINWQPMNKVFSTVPLTIQDWAVAIILGLSVLLVAEIFKFAYKKAK
ncbi:MAG TPA: cation-translocating P-type ATPase [Candidatus Kapabacteria bacterium]|nr:cation-translocating P-type ATPase [Candidatus Kapabacteria bacterium]